MGKLKYVHSCGIPMIWLYVNIYFIVRSLCFIFQHLISLFCLIYLMKSYSFVHFLVVLIVCVRDCISLQNNTVAKSCNLLKELFLHEPQKVLFVTYYRAFSVHLVFITHISLCFTLNKYICVILQEHQIWRARLTTCSSISHNSQPNSLFRKIIKIVLLRHLKGTAIVVLIKSLVWSLV